MKVYSAINDESVEPDAFDNLPQEIRIATDLAKSMWCPPAARRRLAAFIRKANEVLMQASERHGDGDD